MANEALHARAYMSLLSHLLNSFVFNWVALAALS
jgi:hypothetical protein